MNCVEIPLRMLRRDHARYTEYIPLDVVIYEVTHHNQLKQLHDHNPLTNVRFKCLCRIVEFLV